MSKRKKKERLQRLSKAIQDNTSAPPTTSGISDAEYEPLLLGVLSTLTGYRNSDDLFKIYQRCIENGKKYLNTPDALGSNYNLLSVRIDKKSPIP